MKISLTEVSKILNITTDEVMFLHQNKVLIATVAQSSLNWEFLLSEVLDYKSTREE